MRVHPKYKYSENHLWFSLDGDIARVGVTEFILKQGDGVEKVKLEVSEDDEFDAGDIIGVVIAGDEEFEIIMPFSGRIIRINWEAIETPDIINEMPYSDGWLLEVKFDDVEEDSLMSPSEYKEFVMQFVEEEGEF